MNRVRNVAAVVAVTLAAVCPAVAAPKSRSARLSDEDKLFGLALIWKEASYNFAFFDQVPKLDWDAEFRATIPRVLATRTDLDYYRTLQRFVVLLGEGHTGVSPPWKLLKTRGANPPIELEEIERKAVVVNTATLLESKLPVGSVLLAIGGTPIIECLRRDIFPYVSHATEHDLWRRSIRRDYGAGVGLLQGPSGTTVVLQIETPNGDRRTVRVKRLSDDADHGNVEWLTPQRHEQPVFAFRWLEGGIAYAALNSFGSDAVVKAFEEALPKFRKAKAIILDVRNNGGGNTSHGWNIGRHFMDRPATGSLWKTPQHVAAFKAWGRPGYSDEHRSSEKERAWHIGEVETVEPASKEALLMPTAVLIGSSTYSAAEDFLCLMRSIPHVKFVGSRSGGSTGQPLVLGLPGGGGVRITSKRDSMSDGTEFVGYGVEADVRVMQTVAGFRAGRDLVLERAVEILTP